MSDEKQETALEKNNEQQEAPVNQGRRSILKALATLPVIGGFFYALYRKRMYDDQRKKNILDELGVSGKAPEMLPKTTLKKAGDLLRVGIIGYGGRGEHLVRGAGFAHPDFLHVEADQEDSVWWMQARKGFLEQEDMNVRLTGVCDVFDIRAERGLAASRNDLRPGGGRGGLAGAKRYRRYQDLLAAKDIDAVIIATPDHWHAQMTIDAVEAGKHVYCEKCITRTEEEVYRVAAAIENSEVVFQLGHQNPQQVTYKKAGEIVNKNILGKITLVETTTNRNDPNGAWVYDIHPKANPQNIDWEQFQAAAPNKVPFSLERFFRWRCWYDYGTGLSGDLFSHEFDAINQILDLGIPRTVTASGGIYFFKDGRDVPDTFQVVCEYPDRELTLVYSATLANGRNRGRIFMGHDATMEVGGTLMVTAERESTRFKKKIEDQIIDPSLPLLSYQPGSKGLDAISSATQKYFATKGLMYTYRGGRYIDLAHLHVKEWLDAIRTGQKPSCGIERGFQEGITCHMATRSFREGRRMEWDPVSKRII